MATKLVKIDAINLDHVTKAITDMAKLAPRLAGKTHKRLAEKFEFILKKNVNVWTGRLRDSIQVKPLSDYEFEVVAYSHWRPLEYGHPISATKISDLPNLLIRWAYDKFGEDAIYVLSAIVKRGYIMAHPFLEISMEELDLEVKDILDKSLHEWKTQECKYGER